MDAEFFAERGAANQLGDLTIVSLGPSGHVRLVGEVDLAGAARLYAEVTRLHAEGCTVRPVDLTRVTFMDAAGLGALVWLRRRLEASTRGTRFIFGHGQPRRLLQLTRMEGAFELSGAPLGRQVERAVPDPAR